MQLGGRHRLALGLGLCAVALAVGTTVPHGDPEPPSVGLQDAAHDIDLGGGLAATVSWPSRAGEIDRSDICVALIDDSGGAYGDRGGSLQPVPGAPTAARWTVHGLAPGRYTVYVAQCVTPAPRRREWVEPQYLGGAADAEAAWWVEVEDGTQVDVGTIALRRTGLETWPEGS